MTPRFSKDDDPTEILQFSFFDPEGNVTKSSVKSAIKPPYPVKYYINGLLTIIGLTVFLLWNYGVIPGTKLGFYCNDPLFSHKYRGDTVSPTILGLGITFIFPLIYFSIESIRQKTCKDIFSIASFFEYYVYLKQFIIGIIIVGGVTEIETEPTVDNFIIFYSPSAKTIVGEHRPHFFDTCMPDTNFNCTDSTYMFDFTCTNPNFDYLDKTDASRSFPSGHASLSWFTALFCAYIVHSRLPIHRTGTALKLLLLAISITFGLTCSLTRITDRRHHWWDVLAGTVIGAVGAVYVIWMTHFQVTLLHKTLTSVESDERNQLEITTV